MQFLRILLLTLGLAPSRGEADLVFRGELAEAIARATPDEHMQDVLARLAWFEASFARRVAYCRVTGDGGRSLGVFQVQPRTREERAALCGSLDGQARIALSRIEESLAACARLEPRDRLSGYTTGRCRAGDRKARERWGQR